MLQRRRVRNYLLSEDPSRFYELPTHRIHQGDGDLRKELVEVLPVGPLAVFTSWMSAPDHHPVYGSEFKLLVGVDDKRDALSAAVYRRPQQPLLWLSCP